MKLEKYIFSIAMALATAIVMALATAIILFTCTAFAQEPKPEKGASGLCMIDDANRLTPIKEPVIHSQHSAQPVGKTTKPEAAAISFVPADIFSSARKTKTVETPYPARVRDTTAGKGAASGNDNDDSALAKKLRNPVSSLARLSLRSNFDFALAADREGWRYMIDVEPVIPIRLNKDWNLISRTSLPIIQQDGISDSTVQTGLGDALQSLFISPRNTEPLFWGIGPALLIPTATDTRLGAGKLGLGPTLAIGRQQREWTYGALARHIWSVAGHRDRADVRSTFIQSFVAYTTKSAWTFSLDTESTYDWVGKYWSAPIHLEVTKVVRFGMQPVSVGGALRCWAATPPGGPQACGVRFTVTPLFPAR